MTGITPELAPLVGPTPLAPDALDALWSAARAAFDEGRIEDAELAAAYLLTRARAQDPFRWKQGELRPPLATADDVPPLVHFFATTRVRGMVQPVAAGLVAWAMGRREVALRFDVPDPRELLALQARGARCVSLLERSVDPSPHASGLAFATHDLCHLEKFYDPEHRTGQVGFFALVHAAFTAPGWASVEADLDETWRRDRDAVVADMNGSAVFLFAALKMKLKMAARRKVARDAGRSPSVGGPLDAEEAATFDALLDRFFDVAGMPRALWDAARAVNTRRDAEDAATRILAYFESAGAVAGATLPR
jgi:hypothetical protein